MAPLVSSRLRCGLYGNDMCVRKIQFFLDREKISNAFFHERLFMSKRPVSQYFGYTVLHTSGCRSSYLPLMLMATFSHCGLSNILAITDRLDETVTTQI